MRTIVALRIALPASLSLVCWAAALFAQQADVFLDDPLNPRLPLVLERAREPGKALDISELKGQIVVLRAAAPECGHWHQDRDGIAPYRKLFDEYHDRVTFVAVRTDFLHNTDKPYAQRFREAGEYCRKMSLPGIYLVDNDQRDFIRFAGGKDGWAHLAILNREGKIVCRHGHSPSFQYFDARMVLDRLLDPDFDRAYRQGFPDKATTLPRIDERGSAITYGDDFESYKDSYDFRLQPCWGFRQRNTLTGGLVAKDVGRDRSQAAVILGGWFLQRGIANIEHVLPRPLEHGHIRYYVRRGPAGWDKEKPRTVFRTTLYGTGKSSVETIQADGPWQKERFSINGKATPIQLSRDGWHEIRITVRPNGPMHVLIDDKPVATLPAGSLSRVVFNAGHHGAYLDDFEITYVQ